MSDPELLPFRSLCAACLGEEAAVTFCVFRCVRNPNGVFESVDRIGDDDPAPPHLHRTCKRCGYEWLERCVGLPLPEQGEPKA